jgi:hypothetical protein
VAREARRPSAAKAGYEKKPLIAAVNRCATQNPGQMRTQNQAQWRVFPLFLKAVPFQNRYKLQRDRHGL